MEAAAILVFAVLPCVVLVVTVVMGYVFLKEAFASPASSLGALAASNGRLPLLSGDALSRWAADLAQRVVARYAVKPRTGRNAVALAREIESQTSLVLDRSLPARMVANRTRCSDGHGASIRVTAPEAFAITAELHNLPSYVTQLVYERARKNLRGAAAGTPESAAVAEAVCPLLVDGGRCSVYSVRPIQCRGRSCPNCDQDPSCEENCSTAKTPPSQFAATFGEAVSEGFSRGLSAAGLDGRAYELNRALVQALDEPKVVDRWVRGEQAFDAAPQAV